MHKSYTDNRKLRMIIVKDQWTAIVANFVRMSSNSFMENYYLCHDRGRKNFYLSTYPKHILEVNNIK